MPINAVPTIALENMSAFGAGLFFRHRSALSLVVFVARVQSYIPKWIELMILEDDVTSKPVSCQQADRLAVCKQDYTIFSFGVESSYERRESELIIDRVPGKAVLIFGSNTSPLKLSVI